jgi:hypothetical protein
VSATRLVNDIATQDRSTVETEQPEIPTDECQVQEGFVALRLYPNCSVLTGNDRLADSA